METRLPKRTTFGDVLDVMFGGPETYISFHCKDGTPAFTVDAHHRACLGFYGGRTCDCWCHS